jgi:hypothetical protein
MSLLNLSTPFLSTRQRPTLARLLRIVATVAVLSSLAGLTSCAGNKRHRKGMAAPLQLPKPAPMRVAKDTSHRRNPPLLPKTIVNIRPVEQPEPTPSSFMPAEETKTVESTTPKFINNEQPQDFFQGAGDTPVGESVLGSFFDNVFRPANPANQPVSSTSYTVD